MNTFFVCLFVCFYWQIGCDFSYGNWGCFPTSLNLMCWIVKWLTRRPTFLSSYSFLKMISSSRGGVRQRQCTNDLNLCSCWLISILVPHVVISNLWHSSKGESNIFSIKKTNKQNTTKHCDFLVVMCVLLLQLSWMLKY